MLRDDLIEALGPWITDDLADYLRAIAGMFEEVEPFVIEYYDDDGDLVYGGWAIMFDPDQCPAIALPYLAQYVGERLPAGLPVADQRKWIRDRPNARRGSRMSIVRAAMRTLTGQKTVYIHERDTGSTDDHLGVYTLPAETPDAARVQQDIRRVMPADIVLNWGSATAQSYDAAETLAGGTRTNAQMAAFYPTYAAAQTTSVLPAGWTIYTAADV